MIYIKKASLVDRYKLEVSFTNGEEGIADMHQIVQKGVFQKLKDQKEFSNFIVDPYQQTIIWDNGALDIAPESVYFQAFKNKPELQGLFQEWGYLERYA